MHTRESALNKWLQQTLNQQPFQLQALTGDASFRRYYRVRYDTISRIVMDAPPEKEALEPFMRIAALLRAENINTPLIHASDEEKGFALLDDFGDILLYEKLRGDNTDLLYKLAMMQITRMQLCSAPLPVFDKAFILKELSIFQEWFLQGWLGLDLTTEEHYLINQTYDYLADELMRQPQTFVHRDYHSRNIMLVNQETNLGIIDFQDAMRGPFTYDLVSLLKDCYIKWPKEQVYAWVDSFYRQSPAAQLWSLADFKRGFQLCGLQRHLKVLGVFSRLHLRDNKSGYLKDLPLTLTYVLDCLQDHKELHGFYQFMLQRIKLP